MFKKHPLTILLTLLILLTLTGGFASAQGEGPDPDSAALGTAFTYQGQLKDAGGSPVTASCDMQFALFDASSGGSQVGTTLTKTAVSVSSGLFTVSLDFGAGAFTGPARWLRIGVRCPAGSDTYTTLSPRQELTPAPYALYSMNADKLDGVQGSSYQRRVGSACAVGSTIRAINSDGSVDCQEDAPLHRTGPGENTSNALDSLSGGETGQYTSITIGSDGLPVISYYDVTNANLRVAHCPTIDCSGTPTLNTVDSAGDVGKYTSIAIGTDGLPVISYYDTTHGSLKAAHCSDVSCSSALITTVHIASGMLLGQYSSIAIGGDGYPIISYFLSSAVTSNLQVAHCTTITCSASVHSTADAASGAGQYSSIAQRPDGLAAISYFDSATGNLKIAKCANFDCSTAYIQVIDNSANVVGQYTSLVYGYDGLPVISYYDATAQELKVARCEDAMCNTFSVHTLDSNGEYGRYSSITIGADGLPVISFYRANTGLRVAHCQDVACSGADISAPLNNTLLGQFTAITLGVDGLPIISYYDGTNPALETMHCGDPFCVSTFWRR